MFPLRDDNPTLHRSITTFVLIALNVIAWIFIQQFGTEPGLSRSVCEFGAIPGELLGTVEEGTRIPISRNRTCVIGGEANWYTLVTSMFMHGGWFHLIGNLWFLFVFGDNVEDSMGRIKFFIFYILCGLTAAGIQLLSNPNSAVPMVGASGAISGVLGAYAVLYPKARVHMLIILVIFIDVIIVPAYIMLGYWFFLQLLGALPTLGSDQGGVAFWAHVGGFAAGTGLVFLFRNKERVEEHKRIIEQRWG